jgi:thiol-disulfide isomerase/thioredoxin
MQRSATLRFAAQKFSLTVVDLREKVVLVQFWTYTCINWLRTLSYVCAWAKRYKDQGLLVIGVHTPEFAFEKDAYNVHVLTVSRQIGHESSKNYFSVNGRKFKGGAMATKEVAKVEPLDRKLEVVVLGVSEFLPYTSNTMRKK